MNLEQLLGLICIGLGTGLYSAFVGAGGGFILVPVLLLLYPLESHPEILTCISMAVVLFTSLSGTEA